MQKLSGLVLDFYDDPDREVLKALGAALPGGHERLEEVTKTAHILSDDERDRLPDDTFALVLLDGDVSLKKFAMADRGNTQLSIAYFLQTRDRLPEEAQKVAARNLCTACGWYGLEPPEELQKVALSPMTLLSAGLVLPGAVQEGKKNLQAVRGAGGTILTPGEVRARRAQMGV